MTDYEKYLNNISKSKKVFILTAENMLALRNVPSNKILEVGICEQSLIGFASGLALEGLKPWVYTITPFLIERPFEQIKIAGSLAAKTLDEITSFIKPGVSTKKIEISIITAIIKIFSIVPIPGFCFNGIHKNKTPILTIKVVITIL